MKSTLESSKTWLERLLPTAPVLTYYDITNPTKMLVLVEGKRVGGLRGQYILILRFKQQGEVKVYLGASCVSEDAARCRMDIKLAKYPLPDLTDVEALLADLEQAIDESIGPARVQRKVTA